MKYSNASLTEGKGTIDLTELTPAQGRAIFDEACFRTSAVRCANQFLCAFRPRAFLVLGLYEAATRRIRQSAGQSRPCPPYGGRMQVSLD